MIDKRILRDYHEEGGGWCGAKQLSWWSVVLMSITMLQTGVRLVLDGMTSSVKR